MRHDEGWLDQFVFRCLLEQLELQHTDAVVGEDLDIEGRKRNFQVLRFFKLLE